MKRVVAIIALMLLICVGAVPALATETNNEPSPKLQALIEHTIEKVEHEIAKHLARAAHVDAKVEAGYCEDLAYDDYLRIKESLIFHVEDRLIANLLDAAAEEGVEIKVFWIWMEIGPFGFWLDPIWVPGNSA